MTTILKKEKNKKTWQLSLLEMVWRKRNPPLHCWWECKLVQPLRRTAWRILKKLKTELPYDPAIPLLGIYPEKTIIRKDKIGRASCRERV